MQEINLILDNNRVSKLCLTEPYVVTFRDVCEIIYEQFSYYSRNASVWDGLNIHCPIGRPVY